MKGYASYKWRMWLYTRVAIHISKINIKTEFSIIENDSIVFTINSAKIFSCLTVRVRARIVLVMNDSTTLVCFPYFTEHIRQTNECTPFRIDRPTLRPHDQVFWRNRRPFASQCFERKRLSLDMVHLEWPIHSYVGSKVNKSFSQLCVHVKWKVW